MPGAWGATRRPPGRRCFGASAPSSPKPSVAARDFWFLARRDDAVVVGPTQGGATEPSAGERDLAFSGYPISKGKKTIFMPAAAGYRRALGLRGFADWRTPMQLLARKLQGPKVPHGRRLRLRPWPGRHRRPVTSVPIRWRSPDTFVPWYAADTRRFGLDGALVRSHAVMTLPALPRGCRQGAPCREWSAPLPTGRTRPRPRGARPSGDRHARPLPRCGPCEYARYSLRTTPCIDAHGEL